MDYTTFRPAVRGDLPRLLELYGNAIERMRLQGIDQWDEVYPHEDDLRRDIRRHELYVLEQDAPGQATELLAAVVLNEEQEPQYRYVDWEYPAGKVGVIHRLCVSARQQGRGCGRNLVRLSEQHLRQMDCVSVRLDAFPKNPPAMRLYPSLGYRFRGRILLRKGVFHCFEKRLTPQTEKTE